MKKLKLELFALTALAILFGYLTNEAAENVLQYKYLLNTPKGEITMVEESAKDLAVLAFILSFLMLILSLYGLILGLKKLWRNGN